MPSEKRQSDLRKKSRIDCEYCSKSLASLWGLDAHIKTVHGEKCYNCRFCAKAFARKDHLLNHEKSIHTGLKACSECGEAFNGREGLLEHIQSSHPLAALDERRSGSRNSKSTRPRPHRPRKRKRKRSLGSENHTKIIAKSHKNSSSTFFSCSFCSANFLSRYRLKRHVDSAHDSRSPMHSSSGTPCPLCEEILLGKPSKLIRHLGLKHSEHSLVIMYKCSECSGTFTSEPYLLEHISSFHTIVYCLICSCSFIGFESLLRHVRKIHFPNKKGFRRKGRRENEVDKEINKNNDENKDEEKEDIVNGDEVIFYECHVCGVSLPSSRDYISHVLESHSLGKSVFSSFQKNISSLSTSPHILTECEICYELFANDKHWEEHMVSNHKRALLCELCEEPFENEGLLDEHIGENHSAPFLDVSTPPAIHPQLSSDPFLSCLECKMSFEDAVDLERHLSIFHPVSDDESEGTLKTFLICNLCESLCEDQESYSSHICSFGSGSNFTPFSNSSNFTPPSESSNFTPPSQSSNFTPFSNSSTLAPPSESSNFTPPSESSNFTPPSQSSNFTSSSQSSSPPSNSSSPPSQSSISYFFESMSKGTTNSGQNNKNTELNLIS